MMKKIISLLVLIVIVFSLMGCDSGSKERAYGEKPEGFDEPMPAIWEEILSGNKFDISAIDIETASEITIGADIMNVDFGVINRAINLENVYVEEGNEKFESDDGVLYSKSYETLYIWPIKKPVTTVRNTVKYFAPWCFFRCDMPEDFELPDGTITIGELAFFESNLVKLHIKSNVKSVGGSISKEATGSGISYIYPETCKTIEISAPIVYPSFYLNNYFLIDVKKYGIETIIFNEGVREIRTGNRSNYVAYMFQAKTIKFPSTLTAIGDVYFPVNFKVEKYVLPESLTYLCKYAFDDYAVEKPRFSCSRSSVIEEPWRVSRDVYTEFDCKNQLTQDYIGSKKPKWDKRKNDSV